MASSEHGRGGIDELGRVVFAQESMQGLLRRVADTALQVVNRCDSASVSMAEAGQVSTWASSDEAAERADRHQYGTDQGPCLDAIRTGEPHFVDSLDDDERWPEFTSRAVDEGMVSLYSLPLKLDGRTVGALNLYSRSKSFAYHDLQAAEALADQAAVTLTNAKAYHEVRGKLEQCQDQPTD